MSTDTTKSPPQTTEERKPARAPGVTLLDHFAAHAMGALLHVHPSAAPSNLATRAYDVADAMVAERGRR